MVVVGGVGRWYAALPSLAQRHARYAPSCLEGAAPSRARSAWTRRAPAAAGSPRCVPVTRGRVWVCERGAEEASEGARGARGEGPRGRGDEAGERARGRGMDGGVSTEGGWVGAAVGGQGVS